MKVTVDENTCIGCGACMSICPDVFEFNDEGFMGVKKEEIDETIKDDIMDAKDSCPVNAIDIL